jgi:hypothetical protein
MDEVPKALPQLDMISRDQRRIGIARTSAHVATFAKNLPTRLCAIGSAEYAGSATKGDNFNARNSFRKISFSIVMGGLLS